MAPTDSTIGKLRRIRALVDQVLRELDQSAGHLSNRLMRKKQGENNHSGQEVFKGATGGVRFLISKGFFDHKQLFGDIRKALSKNNYHYSKQAVQMALNGLSKLGGPLVAFKESTKKIYAKRK